MDPLPMAPSCQLDDAAMRLQLGRYRRAGHGAQLLERTAQRLVVELDEGVDVELVEEAVAVERECCPFFVIDWVPPGRRLTVAVTSPEEAPALEAIAFALGVDEASPAGGE